MELTWPKTDRGDALIAKGTHWRVAWKECRGMRMRMRQYGFYRYQLCWRGYRLRFVVDREEPLQGAE